VLFRQAAPVVRAAPFILVRSRDTDHSSRHEQLPTRPWRVVRGWVWDDLTQQLEKVGHRVTVVDQLPSAGTDPAALGDLTADANHVRAVLDSLDEPVVLVGHSYGGMVITELADHPKVRHSVYLAAFWPQRGQSLLDLIGDGPSPPWIVARDDGALGITEDFELARDSLCADLDRDRAREMFSHTVLQSAAALGTPSTAPTVSTRPPT
jgi:pimeloyl-ACP methyl ester carboxylesterase